MCSLTVAAVDFMPAPSAFAARTVPGNIIFLSCPSVRSCVTNIAIARRILKSIEQIFTKPTDWVHVGTEMKR